MKYLYEGHGDWHYKYRMVSATTTMVVIHTNSQYFPGYNPLSKTKILVGRRSRTAEIFPSKLSLPGGFLNAGQEQLEECASRELKEETGLVVPATAWRLFATISDPNLDPRAHVINSCYYTTIINDEAALARAGDDLEEIIWVTINEIATDGLPRVIKNKGDWAFNHGDILINGYETWLIKG